MIPIYMHEYTIVPWNRERLGIQQVTIVIVTKEQKKDSFATDAALTKIMNMDCNISHKLLIEGYLDE